MQLTIIRQQCYNADTPIVIIIIVRLQLIRQSVTYFAELTHFVNQLNNLLNLNSLWVQESKVKILTMLALFTLVIIYGIIRVWFHFSPFHSASLKWLPSVWCSSGFTSALQFVRNQFANLPIIIMFIYIHLYFTTEW